MIRHEGTKLQRVILVPPAAEYTNLTDLGAHNFSEYPNKERAIVQHQCLRNLITSFDVEVISLNELAGHPNSVFVRDVAVITPDGALIMRMGIESRRGEESWIENGLTRRDIPILDRITRPGTAEGGDVIIAGEVAFIGHSTRTNDAGIDQVRQSLIKMGYRVRIARIPYPYLHIGGAMSVIAPDRIVCTENIFPNSYFDGFEMITVPKSDFTSGNVITVCPNEVIADSMNSKTIEILRKNNVVVHDLDLSEFISGTGGPSCLILPITRE